jgi:hypothetical protein
MGAGLSKQGGQLVITTKKVGVPGFPTGKPLTFFAGPEDTVGIVVERLNKYRGPDHQITALKNPSGVPLPFSTAIRGTVQAIL